jgi:hypothetical protein
MSTKTQIEYFCTRVPFARANVPPFQWLQFCDADDKEAT